MSCAWLVGLVRTCWKHLTRMTRSLDLLQIMLVHQKSRRSLSSLIHLPTMIGQTDLGKSPLAPSFNLCIKTATPSGQPPQKKRQEPFSSIHNLWSCLRNFLGICTAITASGGPPGCLPKKESTLVERLRLETSMTNRRILILQL